MENSLKPKTIAIIPARAGSKRLPCKNKLLLKGIPLVAHSIRYAKAYPGLIDKVIVSTDDLEVKAIAIEEGAEVIDRPKNISGDGATTLSALKHVLESTEVKVENVVLLQPTNPLRPENIFTKAFQKFKEGNYDSLLTVTRSYQKFGKIENNQFVPFNYNFGQRSQDLDPIYFENGLVYIIKASLILEGRLLGDQNFPFIVAHPYAEIDIDHEEDLRYAEFLLKEYN